MTWKKLPPLDGRNNPCLCCPPILAKADMGKVIAVGFGQAVLKRDAKIVLDGEQAYRDRARTEGRNRLPTFKTAEKMAAKDPDHDWRVVLHGPMHGETYQRQGVKEWVLVESNQGFA